MRNSSAAPLQQRSQRATRLDSHDGGSPNESGPKVLDFPGKCGLFVSPNDTDNGACLTVTRCPQGRIAEKFRDLTEWSPLYVRSFLEPQADDSLGISALSGSWESRLARAA